ncbi:MAG: flagellar hook capping FlgD N-terminal domain-containing protein [Bordetella sp.]|nr:flagellar hook capping FlgD N-terminal domain-containing protein [Bordetella sp.]
MAIDSVSALSNSLQSSNLGMQEFLKVLMTQLTYQDPLKPMDNQEFMTQMAQFTTLEQTQQLNSKIETLITNQAALQSVGLIGRTVDVTTSTGTLTATVQALSLAGDAPVLSLIGSVNRRGEDPHWWQDPTNTVRAVAAIRAALSKADPEGAAQYEAGALYRCEMEYGSRPYVSKKPAHER